MAYDVLHMVCLGTHPSLVRFPSPVKELLELFYIQESRIHPMKLKGRIFAVASWVFEALLHPSTNRNTL